MRGTYFYIPKSLGLAVTCTLVFGFNIGFGQTDRDRVESKKTVEPVFRVPKILQQESRPSNPSESQPQAVVAALPNSSSNVGDAAVAGSQPEAPVARVADARMSMAAEINPLLDKKSIDLIPEAAISGSAVEVHPLDRAVELARNGLKHMQNNIHDYTAILVKRERVGEVLSDHNYMRIKIRNPRQLNDQTVPFSIYMKFLKPRACAGREVIWVQGQNNNNLIAHETTPLLKFKNFHLDPDGFLAMKGNKYPIYDAGLENLTHKLIEKAERDRAAGDCRVRYLEGAKINKRPCMVIEVKHPQRKQPYEFHMAKVYIDDELEIPIRFVSYDWPVDGGKPRIIEEYTYVNVKLNVGLTDQDFNISNPAYNFAR